MGMQLKSMLGASALLLAMSSPASAYDGCQVLLCMAHPEQYRTVAMCLDDVNEAVAEAMSRREWRASCPSAKEANNTYMESTNWKIHRNKKGGIVGVNFSVRVYVEGKHQQTYNF
jgi:hypothetical protein